jgi:short-subunit dehydrogenase
LPATLEGKVFLITGASSGIGAALAREAFRRGASLVLAARRTEELNTLAQALHRSGGEEQRILTLPCDITVRSEAEGLVDAAWKAFDRLDVLINNAGRGHCSAIEDTTDEMIQSMFALNVFPLWYTTRPALPRMRRMGSGHIINIASMAGKIGFPFNSAYVAAKHAVVGFTAALRMELAGSNIHATCVCPSTVATDWAASTEGRPMMPLFAARPLAERLAREQGIRLPSLEGTISAGAAAERILQCVGRPVPELFTHRGSYEYCLEAAEDRAAAEKRQIPMALAERAVYEKLLSAEGSSFSSL